MKKILSTLLIACTMLSQVQAQDYKEVWIYPDGNFPELNGHENDTPRTTERWTAQPYMHIYRASTDKAAARTVVCLPGGGYSHLSLVNEGSSWAPYFNELGINFVVLCIEGKYPNYESVIPRDNPYKVQMSRDTLKMALRRVQLSADGSSNMATMLSDGTAFVIEASNILDSKSGSERVPVQQTDAFLPQGFKIGMKISSTLDLLDLLDEDNIVFYFSDPSRAFLLRNESPKLQSKTLLQMPMLVNEA